jgi:hypothetical protein
MYMRTIIASYTKDTKTYIHLHGNTAKYLEPMVADNK